MAEWDGADEHRAAMEYGHSFCAPLLPAQATGSHKDSRVAFQETVVAGHLEAAVPGLARHLKSASGWTPAPHNWSFRHDEPIGGFNRYGWAAVDQAEYDQAWRADCDELADELIEKFQYMWCWAARREFPLRLPGFVQSVTELATLGRIGQGHTYRDRPDSVTEHALMYGSFDHVRARRAWAAPCPVSCALCSRVFPPETLSHWMLASYGRPRYCPECCCRARTGHDAANRESAITALARARDALEHIPRSDFRAKAGLGALPDDVRDVVLAAMILVPSEDRLYELLGGRPWTNVLRQCGLVGEAWRPGRGMLCAAKDGHQCRSLAERSIDDFLHDNEIWHEPEPRWGKHPEWNPSGRKRADWRLADGTYVEYAGMMADDQYAKKMSTKVALADDLGIRLIIILPDDLAHLRIVFREWLAPDQLR